MDQLKLSQNNPSTTIKDQVHIPENPVFTRTKTVQYLFDHVQAATKELHQTKYDQDSNYHNIKCIETSSPGKKFF